MKSRLRSSLCVGPDTRWVRAQPFGCSSKKKKERQREREKIDQTHPMSEHRAQPERLKGVPADTGINYPLLPHRRLLFLLPAKLRLKGGRVAAGGRARRSAILSLYQPQVVTSRALTWSLLFFPQYRYRHRISICYICSPRVSCCAAAAWRTRGSVFYYVGICSHEPSVKELTNDISERRRPFPIKIWKVIGLIFWTFWECSETLTEAVGYGFG